MNSFLRTINLLLNRDLQARTVLLAWVIALPALPASADTSAGECVKAQRNAESLYAANTMPSNRCPVAEAGIGLPVQLGTPMPLDAHGSSDVDGQRLQFEWSLVRKPSGSGATVDNPGAVRTAFTPDLAGDYTFEVRVTDELGASAVDRVTFSTDNVAPIADAGSDITATVGEQVTLDALRSFDFDADHLTYQWNLLEQPSASSAALTSSRTPQSSILIDQEGDYRISLQVKDAASSSEPAELTLSTNNSSPVASSGKTRTVGPHSTVVFDSSRSDDVDQDALSYHWSILSAPDGYDRTFDNAASDSPTLQLGEAGLYVVQLIVADGLMASHPATTLIEVKRDRMTDFELSDFLPLTNRSGGDDTDGDGVLDPVDNCVLVANAPQRDTDGDGIGNFCDPDLNNDGVVNFLDITAWTPFFLSNDDDADFNGDGVVNFLDYIIITNTFLQQPGPPGTIVWVSLVDGNFNDRTNWEPQIVPSAGTTAIIDVAPAVTVTQSGGSVMVKNLVQNENLVLSSTTFEATGALELGGTLVANSTTINNTQMVPSLAGTGTATINGGTHNWTANTIGVPTTLLNSANVNNSNGLTVNSTLTIDAPTSPTGLILLNDQTLDGTGEIVFDGVGNSQISEPRLLPAASTTTNFAAGLTIRGGKGTIGAINASIVMDAMVSADIDGESIQLQGATSGTGLLQAVNNGGIILSTQLDNAGNIINLDTAAGTLTLSSAASLRNAVMLATPGSVMTAFGTTNFENLAFTGDIVLPNTSNVNVFGALTLNGNLLIDAPVSPTGLTFQTDVLLDGNATITFDGVGNTQISEPRLFPAAGTTLTIADTVTINGGKGTVGASNALLNLLGDVNANVAGEAIQITGNTWNSTGTLSATNGGEIFLSGIFDNGGATVNLDTADGALTLSSAAQLKNADMIGTPGTNMALPSGTTVYDAISFQGDITMENTANTNVSNGLTLNGTLTINAPVSPTGLIFVGSQTLDGTATVVFNGVGNTQVTEPRLLPNSGTTLTIGENVTVRGGKGTIGATNADLIMLGDIIADLPGEEIRVGGASWSANGSFEASGGGLLAFYGAMDNAGDTLTIDAATGGLELEGGATLANGTFNGTAGTEMVLISGTTFFDNMTINHDVRHLNTANTNVSTAMTLNGTSTIVSPSSPTGYIFTESLTLGGVANFVFDSAGNSQITEPRLLPVASSVLTIEPGVTISGTKGTVGATNAAVVMNGTVSADSDEQFIRVSGNGWSGTGTLQALNGGGIELQGVLDNADATLELDTAGGSLNVLPGTTLRNATLNGTAGTNLVFNSSTYTIDNLVVTADMTINNTANLNTSNGLTLNGTATINAPISPTGFVMFGDQTIDGMATFVFNGEGNTIIAEPRILPSAGSTLTLGADVLVRGNFGTLGATNADLVNNGVIRADEGQINVRARANPTGFITNNGSLEAVAGNTLSLSDTLSNGEIYVAAGSLVDVTGGVTQSSTGVLRIDTNGTTGNEGMLRLSVGADLDGELSFNAVEGYSPFLGETFTVIDGPNLNAFSSVMTSGLGVGQTVTPIYNALSVTVSVTN